MALKGNPFEKDTFRPPLPITGTRVKPKFEKIELGAVPSAPPTAPENKSQIEKAQNDSRSQVEAQSPTAKTEQFDDKKQYEINGFVLNGEQSVNKQGTIGEQSVNKQRTIGEQKNETVNKRLSKRGTSQLTNGKQKVDKRLTKISFFELIGLQKKLVVYVYNSCKLTRSDVSGPISLQSLAESLKSTAGSVKTTAKRLREKGIITTVDQKEGRGGFTKYRLNDAIYNEILQDESVNNQLTNGGQMVDKRLPKRGTERGTNPSSSSSSFVIPTFSNPPLEETTNTGLNENSQTLPDDWQAIECTDLYQYNVKFGRGQIGQVMRWGKVTPQELQDSIDALVFDLRVNKRKFRSGALTAFMGILKNGPYGAPENFESESQRLIRENNERLIAQTSKTEALLEEQEKLQERVKLQDPNFIRWVRSLTAEDRKKLAPEASVDKSDMQLALLRAHFTKNRDKLDFSEDDFRIEAVQRIEAVRKAHTEYQRSDNPDKKEDLISEIVKHETRLDEIFKILPGLKTEIDEVSEIVGQFLTVDR